MPKLIKCTVYLERKRLKLFLWRRFDKKTKKKKKNASDLNSDHSSAITQSPNKTSSIAINFFIIIISLFFIIHNNIYNFNFDS